MFLLLLISLCEPVQAETYAFSLQWGGTGSANGQFERPWGIAIDGNNNVYVTQLANPRVQKFSSSGVFFGVVGDLWFC